MKMKKLLKMNNAHMAVFVKFLFIVKLYLCREVHARSQIM